MTLQIAEAAILEAERKLVRARLDATDAVSKFRSAIHARVTAINTQLTRPSSFIFAAGLGAFIAFAVQRCSPRRARVDPAVAATSIGGILAAFAARQAWQSLSRMLFKFWTTRNDASFPRPAHGLASHLKSGATVTAPPRS